MFKPVPMIGLRAVLLAEDERAVLMSLGEQGVLHLTRTSAGPDTAPIKPLDGRAELERCDALLERCNKLVPRPSFPNPTPKQVLLHDISLDAMEATLKGLEEKAATLLAERQGLLSRKLELDTRCDRVSIYRELDVPLDAEARFSFLHFIIGTVPEDRLDQLSGPLGGNAIVIPLSKIGGRQPVLIMTTPANRIRAQERLQQLEFQPADLPITESSTATAYFVEQDRERTRVAAMLRDNTERRNVFDAETAGTVAVIRDRLRVERLLAEARQHFPRTSTTLLLSGWIPAPRAALLKTNIMAITRNRCAVELRSPSAADGESVPVLLDHRGWLRPFQRLVSTYGLPAYGDLEPTLFVAISYVIMFGMMFGDAGQGAILAAAGWLALIAARSEGIRDIGRILVLGGLSSIGFGLVYGSYFGIPHLKAYALWRDPLEGDPLPFMLTAIGAGIAVISIGLVLNMINRFRRNEWAEGWLGHFGVMGCLFYWGGLALLANYAVFESHGLAGLAAILFLALPLAGWMLKGPVQAMGGQGKAEPGRSGRMAVIAAESLIGVLEGITAYLANTTSFVRLAAYSMSHAALLMATFALAAELRDSGSLGGVWGILVIIIGNAIAIALEGIIAAVQALRLEYYEFFSKFLPGTGLPFTPFHLYRGACHFRRGS